jgi:hypothetical protein
VTSLIDLCPRKKETAVKPTVVVGGATGGAGNTVSAMPPSAIRQRTRHEQFAQVDPYRYVVAAQQHTTTLISTQT